MKRLFTILVAIFMFANVSFAQKKETFFGVKFGASEQEVINAFKKHGLVLTPTDNIFIVSTLSFSPAEKKEYINYFNYDWDRVEVEFVDSVFSGIVFEKYFKSKKRAFESYVSFLSKLFSSVHDVESYIGDYISIVSRTYLGDFPVIFRYFEMAEEYTMSLRLFDEEANIPEIVAIEEEEDEEEEVTQTIFTVIEESAMFPGGQEELMKYISENLIYPQKARETGTQGLVYVTFVVERDGSLTDIKILRDIGSGCGEEAVRIVKSMPKWIPAKQRGKAVRMQFNLPVKFTLPG